MKSPPPPQYPVQPPMQVAALNPGRLPYDRSGERTWTYSLFHGCCSATCCMAFWWPCNPYKRITKRLDSLEKNRQVYDTTSDSYCPGSGKFFVDACLSGGVISTWSLRNDVRKRYHIQGTGCKDCLTSSFCLPCTISQAHEEIEAEENARLGRPIAPVSKKQMKWDHVHLPEIEVNQDLNAGDGGGGGFFGHDGGGGGGHFGGGDGGGGGGGFFSGGDGGGGGGGGGFFSGGDGGGGGGGGGAC